MPMKDCDWEEVGTSGVVALPAVWRGNRAGLWHRKNERQRGALGLSIGIDIGRSSARKFFPANA
jgi:hypothetical protein